MLTNHIPALNAAGSIRSPERVIKSIIDYYFIIDLNSLGSFKQKGASFKDTVSEIGPSPSKLSIAINNDLTKIFKEYFNIVDIEVLMVENDSKLHLEINGKCDNTKIVDALNFVYKNNEIVYDELDNNEFMNSYNKTLTKRRFL